MSRWPSRGAPAHLKKLAQLLEFRRGRRESDDFEGELLEIIRLAEGHERVEDLLMLLDSDCRVVALMHLALMLRVGTRLRPAKRPSEGGPQRPTGGRSRGGSATAMAKDAAGASRLFGWLARRGAGRRRTWIHGCFTASEAERRSRTNIMFANANLPTGTAGDDARC